VPQGHNITRMYPFNILILCSFILYFLLLLSMPRSIKFFLPSVFSAKTFHEFLLFSKYTTCHAHLIIISSSFSYRAHSKTHKTHHYEIPLHPCHFFLSKTFRFPSLIPQQTLSFFFSKTETSKYTPTHNNG
jgi:hypothetical protein